MEPPSISAFRCQNNFQQFVTEGIYIYIKVSQVLDVIGLMLKLQF